MKKSERFGIVLSPAEKHILQLLSEFERLPKAAVIRRLIWREAQALEDKSHTREKSLINEREND